MSNIATMMTNKKILIITITFLIALTSLRVFWLIINKTPEHPAASHGVLDLRDWDFEHNPTITLDGEWEFYPNAFILPAKIGDPASESLKTMIQVPGDWSSYVSPDSGSPFGYGTYRLRILIGEPIDQPYGFLIGNIQASSRLYLNGKLFSQFGEPAERPKQYTARSIPYEVFIELAPNDKEIDLILMAANFDNKASGGVKDSLRIGTQARADTERLYSVGFQLATFIVLLIHGLYAFLLFFFNKRNKALFYFFLLTISTAVSVAIVDDRLLLIWFPINYEWMNKIIPLSYVGTDILILLVIIQLYPEYKNKKPIRMILLAGGIYLLVTLASPAMYGSLYKNTFSLFMLAPVIAASYILVKNVKKHSGTIFLLLAAMSVVSSLFWAILKSRGIIATPFYPVDIIMPFIGFATYWFKEFFLNVQQKARLAEQLVRADKLKDDFLANTSHELRTPLHGMINIAQAVLDNEKPSLTEKHRQDLELLISVGHRMSFMLNELLDLSQLNENKIRLQPRSLYIQSVASGAIDMVSFMTEGKPIRLIMDIPDSFPSVNADEQRLVQIFFNLLQNAIKYTYEGSITIQAETVNNMAYIHITDTGIGMDEETKLRAFQPYEQGTSRIGAVSGGIGLGLSICTQLVQLHGGKLTVKSEVGQGSTFTFSLPLSTFEEVENEAYNAKTPPAGHSGFIVVPASQQSEPAAPGDTGRPRILAVDDDPVNLKVLVNILSIEHYEIVTVLNAKDAIAQLDGQHWDLAIIDVMMPYMSGYELTKIIRERFSISELPVLLLTARGRPEDIYSGFISGANDYVTKPADTMELKHRVHALTTLKRSVSERLRIEAAYLQAQIQPHFLFNTLNSITALSDIDTEKMHNLIGAFSSYLRISFDYWHSEELVPLEYELDLVRAYLHIEKERFDERLNIIWDVEADMRLELPPLAIQPLVENAVKHGILSRSIGGTVHIYIREHSENTEIAIMDNGVGMDEEKVNMMLGSSAEAKGIGLINTDRRLKQLYGKGLKIESKPHTGTKVSFLIPKQFRNAI